jgi:hypothetical protein
MEFCGNLAMITNSDDSTEIMIFFFTVALVQKYELPTCARQQWTRRRSGATLCTGTEAQVLVLLESDLLGTGLPFT